MVAWICFWMTTKPTTTATRRQGGTAKNNMFTLTINNFARASRHFVHLSLHHDDMKLPNFKSPLYGVGEHIQKLSVSFS